jgi:hypothetical protein
MPSPHPMAGENVRDDLVQLLEQLNEQLLTELGKPAPGARRLPKRRAGSCPATHNRLLLGRRTGEDKP